jgi:hypothetical protein
MDTMTQVAAPKSSHVFYVFTVFSYQIKSSPRGAYILKGTYTLKSKLFRVRMDTVAQEDVFYVPAVTIFSLKMTGTTYVHI